MENDRSFADTRNLAMVPEGLRVGLLLYIDKGVIPGSFLTAVLKNDLRAACMHGDDANVRELLAIVRYLYQFAPSPCWGEPKCVAAWSKHRGLADYRSEPEVTG